MTLSGVAKAHERSSSGLILSREERSDLDRLESVINRGLTTFIEVGEALAKIRDSRLYRESHATFEDYCRHRWGMTRQHANRTIRAAEVVGTLEPIGSIPTTESQARPLTRLKEPAEQREAWQEATERAGGTPTAAVVEQVVGEVRAKRLPPRTRAPEKLRELVRVATVLPTPTDKEIEALDANDMMLAGLRSARDILDRVIRAHSKGEA